MYRTFNMGIGLTIVVAKEEAHATLKIMEENFRQPVQIIGEIVAGHKTTIIKGVDIPCIEKR
jgi:phosphoribosylformylglycinamidine cyclo-ligase